MDRSLRRLEGLPPSWVRFFADLKTPIVLEQADKCTKWIAEHTGYRSPDLPRSVIQFAGFGASLVYAMHKIEQEETKRRFLEWLIWNKRGRPRKPRKELTDIIYGLAMRQLWDSEMLEAWNMKVSLERQRKNPRPYLDRASFKPDVVEAVLSHRATAESSLASVYARRHNISRGRARNALRAFEKTERWKPAAQV